VEHLRGNERLTAALSAITAAVVGVILNLAVWFGWHVILPENQPINWFGLVVCAVSLAGLIRWKWGVIPVVLGSGLLGVLYHMVLLSRHDWAF
jgi:chromate transporter